MSRVARALAAAAAVLALAGCTAIPTTGAVTVQSAKAPDDSGGLVFIPNPPADGASPEEIVGGFVLAATAGNDYSVARQFLTTAAARTWRPDAGVLVHDQPWTTSTRDGGASVTLTVQTSARVESDGLYIPSDRVVPRPFQLQQVRGQWRISNAPNGVVLSQIQFQRIFQPKTLQFFDPTWSRLVPDLRWFPDSSDPETVVRALLDGPADQIGGGVTVSAFPAGTTLAASPVATATTTAVSLTVPGTPDATSLRRMQQQLSQVFGPAVRLVVNGRAVPTADPLPATQPELAPVVYAEGRFGSLTSSGVSEDAVLGRRVAAQRPQAVTVSARQRLAVVLDASGRTVLVPATGTPRIVDRRSPLVDPSLDQRGWAWSVPKGDPDGLQAFSSRGGAATLGGVRLGGTAVSAIEVSPDGTRLLWLVQTDAGPRAYVAGIERTADGTPTGLTVAQYPVEIGADRAIDATWVDDASVAVLTSDANGQNQAVVLQQLGGLSSSLGRLSNAKALVGTTRQQDDLRALLQDGNLWVRSGTGWQSAFPVTVDVDALAVQR